MPTLKIDGQYVEVDIRSELEEFEWTRPRWSDSKLIAASPFRYDKSPSFFINLESGGWGDSGAYDLEWEKGNFPKLLSFLRNETYEESCEYLLEMYGVTSDLSDYIPIYIPDVFQKTGKKILEMEVLSEYTYRHGYLADRKVSENVQRFLGVGYSKNDRAVTIPWRHVDGCLANVKFRKVYGKTFWYQRDAAPIRTLVYGIDKVYKHNLRKVVVCEAEIDAMSWWTSGVPAVALGGTTVTGVQLDLIRKSPIETLILAMDNDKPGDKMRRKLIEGLSGYVRLEEVRVPAEYKDANEAHTAGVDLSKLHTRSVGLNFDNLFDRYAKI